MQDLSSGNVPVTAESKEPSIVVRYLGLIKALAIIMAVLIIAALALIVATIYSRLQVDSLNRSKGEINLVLPAGAYVSAASIDKSGMLLVLDLPESQQIWRVTNTGIVTQKITFQAE